MKGTEQYFPVVLLYEVFAFRFYCAFLRYLLTSESSQKTPSKSQPKKEKNVTAISRSRKEIKKKKREKRFIGETHSGCSRQDLYNNNVNCCELKAIPRNFSRPVPFKSSIFTGP